MSRRRTSESDLQRFVAKVDRTDCCWLWNAAISTTGYGKFGVWPKTVSAHRFAYEAFVGPIPTGLHIDHLCRNRQCVNPQHLEAVPQRVNTLRGIAPPAINATKTECLRGHRFTDENTYVDKYGGRSCLTCRRMLWQRWYSLGRRGVRSRKQYAGSAQ